MNYIWTFALLLCLIVALFTNPQGVLSAFVNACSDSLTLCLGLVGVYCLWLGIFEILNQCNAIKWFSEIITPIIDKLYGKIPQKAKEYIALNLSVNLIGVGSAATPSAIKAISYMEDGSDKATPAIIMLFVINSTSIQLLPTTVMGMRASLGSISPADIVLPTLIATITTTILGIVLVRIFTKRKWQKQQATQLPLPLS